MRAVGYLRVSTHEQASGGFGLAIQEEAIHTWAREHEAQLVSVERDEGTSGSNGIEKRAGLARALIRLEAGAAKVLVVYRLDRLARDLVLQETTIRRLEQRGGRVVSVTEPDIDGADPTRVLVRQVLGALAEYERAVIRSRMMAGVAAKKAAGGYAGGKPPYGWQAVAGELMPNEAEQAGITAMREMREAGASLREIGLVLDAQAIPPREGGAWTKWSVRQVLARSNAT